MDLNAFIYINNDLFRIVNLDIDNNVTGGNGSNANKIIEISRLELGGEFEPIKIPEILLIDEINELGNNEKLKIIENANIDKTNINSLFDNNLISIELKNESKSVKMKHIYDQKHPIHPWDYDFFEYENDMEEFDRVILCFASSFIMGEYLKINFVIYKSREYLDMWRNYREDRKLVFFDGIWYNVDSIDEINEIEE